MSLTLSEPMTIKPDTVPERRRGLRVSQDRPVKVLEDGSMRFFGGRTRDVSATGLRLELPAGCPIRPGATLSVHVGMTGSGQPLAHRRKMIPARVVWARRDGRPDQRTMELGVEFLVGIAVGRDAA